MALSRTRRRSGGIDYWPGFVDALSTLLLMVVFLLCVFMLGQHFLAQELGGKDAALQQLNKRILELTDLLSLERSSKHTVEADLASLRSTLADAQAERTRLQGIIGSTASAADAKAGTLGDALDKERRVGADALAQVDLLNQQIAALRRQLAAIEEALSASEARDKEAQTRIRDLGSRLNVALAQKVQELSRYRSEFFGRLSAILGTRPDIRVVGDRFVFQSELFFDASAAALRADAKPELDTLAGALAELDRQIPPDIPWVLRVDGHTDSRPIATPQFPSNWALSSARAIAVVQYLVEKGVPPGRLVAAGFGEFQPLDLAQTNEAYARNRRIELKLTER